MNPLPLAGAELRRNPLGCAAIIALIGVAVALSVALSAQERALRLASARAADRFPSRDAVNELHAALGNLHDLLRSVTLAFDGLLVSAVLLVIVTALSARGPCVGALRALGAPPVFVFVTVWLQGALLIVAGVLSGLGLGFVLAKATSVVAGAQLGFDVEATVGARELAFAGALLAVGSLFAAAPSLPLLRMPAARLLRLP